MTNTRPRCASVASIDIKLGTTPLGATTKDSLPVFGIGNVVICRSMFLSYALRLDFAMANRG
jgi:hypothetical protein